MTSSFRKAFGAALIGLTALVTAPVASAAIITGSWDPKLPQEFGAYGWTATVNVSVDPACAVGTPQSPKDPVTVVNVLGLSLGCSSNTLPATRAFRILSAEVGIYDWASKAIIDVLTFHQFSFGEFFYGELELEGDGSIKYLRTPFDSNIQSSSILFGNGKHDFKLALPGRNPTLKYRNANAAWWSPFTTATEPVTETRFLVNTTSTPTEVVLATKLMVGQTVFGVPEPSSLLLAALALGAVCAVSAQRARRDNRDVPATAPAV